MSDQIERAYKCAKCGEPRHQFEEGTDYCLECWPEVAERDDDHGEICRHP
jgi:DNA-directed RNA polymerase subunit RPC12/RpoP